MKPLALPPVDWLVSYPKSGNTWIRLLLTEYFRRRANCPQKFLDVEGHIYHLASPLPLNELSLKEQVMLRPSVVMHAHLLFNHHWYLAKSHHAAEVVEGMPIFCRAFVHSAIYIVRDPRDVAISFAHYLGSEKTIDDAIRIMREPRATLQDENRAAHLLFSWSHHVSSWLAEKDFPTILVTYESLHANTAGVLKRLLQFLGEDEPNEEWINEAVEHCRIDNLRRLEEAGEIQEKARTQDTFFRRGVSQGWKDELSLDRVREIEEDHGNVMKVLGYKLETSPEGIHASS